MITDYPSNSDKLKISKEHEAAQEKKVTSKVTNGTAKAKKHSGTLKEMAKSFWKDDVPNIKNYLLKDVLVPTLKRSAYDIIVNGVSTILFPNGGAPDKRNRNGNGNVSRVSYGSYYDDRDRDRRSEYRASPSPLFDDILFDSRIDAERVLDAMEDILSRYQIASVSDLFELAGIPTDNFQAGKYGWNSMRGVRIENTRDGYVLIMPRAIPLNRM